MINIFEKDIKTKIIANVPIEIENMGKIHTLSLREISCFGEIKYFTMLSIFTGDLSDLKNLQLPENFTYFDYILSICYLDKEKCNEILKFLGYIFKDEIYFMSENLCFFIGNNKDIPANKVTLLDRENFEIFSQILKIQNGIKKKTKETKKEDKKINPKIEALKKKMEEGRKKIAKAKGEEFSLENLISSLSIFLLDINKALDLNIYQANNLYEKFLRKEKYHLDFDAYLVGAEMKHLSINKHWSTEYVPNNNIEELQNS